MVIFCTDFSGQHTGPFFGVQEDGTEVVPKLWQEITATRCVITTKSAVLNLASLLPESLPRRVVVVLTGGSCDGVTALQLKVMVMGEWAVSCNWGKSWQTSVRLVGNID